MDPEAAPPAHLPPGGRLLTLRGRDGLGRAGRLPRRGAEAVEVWRFEGGEARRERFTDRLPVRLGEEAVGEIHLADIFSHG